MRRQWTARALAALTGLVLVATATVTVATKADAAVAATKIMVVGDSISQGSSGDFTWRYRLAKHLTAAGAAYDLVGPRSDLYDRPTSAHGSQSYADVNFDKQHAAKWGEMIGFAKDRIAADVGSSGAQVLLVHLGINDLAWGGTAAGAEEQLRWFIANARSANPNVRIIFGKVLPNQTAVGDAALAGKINDYNNRLTTVTGALSTAASPLHTIGVPAGWDPLADTYDGTHPNPRGEYRIAANYANALATYAGIGRAFGTIPSVPLFGAPASLTATPGNSAATLLWSPLAGADGYYIWQRNATAGQAWQQLPYPVNATTWQATMLTAGQQWEFRVQPVRGRDLGGFSPTATVIPTGAKPATPTGLAASAGNGQAVLRWTEVAGATGYYIYQRDASVNAAWQRLPYPVDGSPWTATLLTNDHIWEYRVTAANGNGESGFSNLIQVTPRPPAPGAPSNLTATAGNGQARLCWSGVSGATGYMVYQKDSAVTTTWTKLPYPVTATCFTAELLTNNHAWHFAVTAVSSGGESGFSNVVQVIPTPPAPAPPQQFTGTAGEGVANLCWQPSAGATAYVVYQRDVTAGQGFGRLPYPLTTTCWQAGGLINGHTYQYKIRAGNANGESADSATVSVTPQAIRPGAPSAVVAIARNGFVIVKWRAAANANNYHLYVRNNPVSAWTLINWNIPTTTVNFSASYDWWEVRIVAVRNGVEGGAAVAPGDVRPLYNTFPGGTFSIFIFPNECTTYAAHQVYARTALPFWLQIDTAMYLNAETWDEAASRDGWAVDHSPRVGDVAQWNQNEVFGRDDGDGVGSKAGPPGHVGIVAQVYTDHNGKRRVVIADYNRASDGGWGWMDVDLALNTGRFLHIAT